MILLSSLFAAFCLVVSMFLQLWIDFVENFITKLELSNYSNHFIAFDLELWNRRIFSPIAHGDEFHIERPTFHIVFFWKNIFFLKWFLKAQVWYVIFIFAILCNIGEKFLFLQNFWNHFRIYKIENSLQKANGIKIKDTFIFQDSYHCS